MKIYSFDINADSQVVSVLKMLYSIDTETPALIINDKTHIGYLNVAGIEEFVNLQQGLVE